jgi:hypothetical protein
MDYAVTRGILAHIDEIWALGPRAYWSHRGRIWSTVFLGSFLADGRDPQIAKGVEELLHDRGWAQKGCFQCKTACMLTAFRRLGYGEHPVVVEERENLAQSLLRDRGIACRAINTSLLSRCYMGLPKLLICFGEVPSGARSAAMEESIAWIVQKLLDHEGHVYVPGNRKAWDKERKGLPRRRADLPEGETAQSWRDKAKARFLAEHGMGALEAKASWTRFGFPLNYNSDILEAMVALATVGTPMDQALEKPLRVIRDKRTADGVWQLEKSLNGQMWVDVEVKGQPSKWITLFAMIALDHFEGRPGHSHPAPAAE